MNFKAGEKVKTIEDHLYLKITKRHIGTVVGFDSVNTTVEAVFNNRKILFQSSELKKVKRGKKKTK
jgi:hypothetical protein